MKRLLTFLLAAVMIFTLALPCFAENGEDSEVEKKYGLHVESDGTITLNGEVFYGFGVNYFGAMNRFNDAYIEGFKGLAAHNIPFVRIPLAGWGPSFYEIYDSDKEGTLEHMRDVLDTAAEYKIGVIVDVTWSDWAIPLHVGGKRSDMAVEDSAVMKYVKEYVATVVDEFKDHPAVWGWEIGNEYNLTADLCDPAFKNYLWPEGVDGYTYEGVNGFDYYTSEELRVFYTEVANVIRQYDSYRMISTGNGEMRPAAKALNKSSSRMRASKHVWNMDWTQNTLAQFEEMNVYYTPDPIDTVCFHLQHGTSGSQTPSYVLEYGYFKLSEPISSYEYFKAYAEAAKKAGKGIFFGEFGDLLDMENDSNNMTVFGSICESMIEAGIQIGASWQFQDYTEDGASGQKLDVLSVYNGNLKAEGKQNVSAAWDGAVIPDGKKQETTSVETTAAETAEKATETEPATEPVTAASGDETRRGCGGLVAGTAVTATVAVSGALVGKKKKE